MLRCKTFFSITVLSVLMTGLAFGAEMPEMPVIEALDMPDMPEVTTLSLDTSFYKPEFPGLKKKKKTDEGDEDIVNSFETTLKSAESTDDIINSFFYDSSVLTAKDISSLSEVGLFDSLSNINNTNYSYLSQTSSTDILLKRVLAGLDDLKKEQSNISQAEKENQNEIKKDLQTFRKRNPAVLRFLINGYDLTSSLSTVFFSQAEEDGSFLFTGDRKYYANRRNNNETFYMLFKAEKALNTGVTYSVTPTVVQDTKNENSFLYQMAQKGNITATKTGNLVVIHYSQNNWKMDLLLDIDNKSN